MSVLPKYEGERVYRQVKARKTSNWDVIIVGSGMGGMCCAAALAHYGKKVLILERHYIPGGFTHMFQRGKFSWDVGVHALGEMDNRYKVGQMLNWLSDNKIKMKSLGSPYDQFFWPGFDIGFPDSREKFNKVLKEKFPDEVDKIDEYFVFVKKVAKSTEFWFAMKSMPELIGKWGRRLYHLFNKNYWELTTKVVMDEMGLSPKLQTVLCAQWGYYGSIPQESSFAIHALTQTHFWGGAYYPEGGAKEIAGSLLKVVEDAGGETLCGADVHEIIVENGKAKGVRLTTGEEFFAKKIVSGAPAKTTMSKLLPEKYRKTEWSKSIMELKNSPPYICLHMGFEGDIKKAGASSTNWWFNNRWEVDNDFVWNIKEKDAEADILYVSFPSLKDPQHVPSENNYHTGECVTFIPYDEFEQWNETNRTNRPEEYKKYKQEIEDRLIAQLKKHMPEVMKHLTFCEMSTPLTAEHFCGAIQGAIYGLASEPKRFNNEKLRPRTPIRNFYLTGIDSMSIGVAGAMTSGMMTAAAIDPRVYTKIV